MALRLLPRQNMNNLPAYSGSDSRRRAGSTADAGRSTGSRRTDCNQQWWVDSERLRLHSSKRDQRPGFFPESCVLPGHRRQCGR